MADDRAQGDQREVARRQTGGAGAGVRVNAPVVKNGPRKLANVRSAHWTAKLHSVRHSPAQRRPRASNSKLTVEPAPSIGNGHYLMAESSSRHALFGCEEIGCLEDLGFKRRRQRRRLEGSYQSRQRGRIRCVVEGANSTFPRSAPRDALKLRPSNVPVMPRNGYRIWQHCFPAAWLVHCEGDRLHKRQIGNVRGRRSDWQRQRLRPLSHPPRLNADLRGKKRFVSV